VILDEEQNTEVIRESPFVPGGTGARRLEP
jgi:hypothetical protein